LGRSLVAATQHGGLTAVRLRKPRQHPQRRALAGAVGAKERRDASGLDAERDAIDDRLRPEALGQVLYLDHATSVAVAWRPR
jgi:hypothetical protein